MAFRTILKTATCLLLSIIAAFGAASPTPPTYKVGVIQTIEHPALDATCRGIQDELAQQGFKDNLQWNWDSAQGNPALAAQIAQKYRGQEVQALIAIATTAAQAALSATRDSKTPVIFASVTDPKGAKLSGNITGVSNFVPAKEQFDVIMKIIPEKKRIGIIYNPGEANSASLLSQMQDYAKEKGLEIIPVTASKTSDVALAAQGLIGKVDAIFINNDNTALAALNAIGQICRDNKIPLFASDGDLKVSGALALLGADQYEIGRQTGRMVAKILRGEAKAADMKIEYPAQVNIEFNDEVAKTLGISVPAGLKKEAAQVVPADGTSKLPVVVMTQIVEHEALSNEREGIVEALKDAGFENGKTVTILYENAQGNIATASQIAAGFSSRQPDVAIGISTPSAQTLIQPMAKQGVPVVFTAVTDPLEAKLVSSLDKRPENVTGVSDGLALQPQLELIQKLLPQAKTIGVLYNPGEANSAKAVLKLRDLVPAMGFSLVFAPTAKTSDTMTSALSLVGKADVIFIPNDNTAMASITGIVSLGRAKGLPVFTPDYDSVNQGVMAVRAASHKAMGYKAGQMVAKILKGEKASDLPVEVNHKMDLAINMTSAAQIGVTIPEDMKKEAKLVS